MRILTRLDRQLNTALRDCAVALPAMIFLGFFGATSSAYADESTAREKVSKALAAQSAKEPQAAYESARQAVTDSSFAALDSSTQHAALVTAYLSAYKTKNFAEAHEFSSRASALPEQSAQDWSYRIYSAGQLKDGRDEAAGIVRLVKLWGPDAQGLTFDSIRRAYRDTASPQFADAQREMLDLLYDARWRPSEGSSASRMWLTLSLLLLGNNQASKAMEVVALVDDPSDLIGLHADWRYKPLLKAKYLQSDPRDADRWRIKVLRSRVDEHPRSLATLQRLARALMTAREDQEALDLMTKADRRIVDAVSAPPFDDIKTHHAWILNAKARALQDLGRFEDAERELRRALEVSKQPESLSHAINLASFLCDLNRPDEALDLLPKMEDASDYGKTQIILVRLTAAVEKADADSTQQHLQYLRDHREVSPETYQNALLIAGEFDAAAAFLVSRLTDPTMRTDALIEMQIYAERKDPPRAQVWQIAREKLNASPNVVKAVNAVGSVSRYGWRYQ